MNGYLASGFAVTGFHGFLVLLALIVFFAAACAAYFAPGHRLVLVLISAGLAVFMLSQLWT